MGETRLMINNGEYGPFILRFSKSMHRSNPKIGRGGKPRIAEGTSQNPFVFAENIERGFNYYQSFEYNNDLPLFNQLTLKSGSLSKSLRYHFLQTTKLSTIGSIASDKLIFAINDHRELQRFNSIIKYSRNKSFKASFTHLKCIDYISPDDKKRCSNIDITSFAGKSFYLQLFNSFEHSDKLINFLKYQINASKVEPIVIGSSMFLRVVIADIKPHYDRLFTHSLIRSIADEPEIFLSENYIKHNDLPLDCIMKRDFSKSYPKAAIVDSGLSESSFLKEWEISTESFVDEADKNPRHGTFVCGRLLTTEDKFGGVTFLNVEIIPRKNRLTIDSFYADMRTLLAKYCATIKIYNISLGTNIIVSEEFSLPAHMLDTLQKDYDVLFIISAGNIQPEESSAARITSPAESVHSITVSSVSHIDTNIQKKHSPSLFTRHGPGAAHFTKPDMASYGGSHEKKFGKLRPIGVFSIGIKNELAEDSGTSHAAPLVTAIAAKLYFKYSHVFKSPMMIKAMLIHYTFLGNKNKNYDVYTGYGIVTDEDSQDNTNATYLHEGQAIQGQIVEIPNIPVPPDMFDDDRATGEIILTLAYKTVTDINYPHYYCMYNLEATLGYYQQNKWIAVLTQKNMVGLPDEFDLNKKDILERFKWQPTKVLRSLIKNKRMPQMLSLRLIPSKRDFYTEKEDMPYCVVISFIHNEKNLYQCLRKKFSEYNGFLEPASDMWKTCG